MAQQKRARGALKRDSAVTLLVVIAVIACGAYVRMENLGGPDLRASSESSPQSIIGTVLAMGEARVDTVIEPPHETVPPAPADVWFVEDFEEFGSATVDPTTDFRNTIQAKDKWLPHYENHWKFASIQTDPIFGQYWRQNLALRTPENCQPGGGTGLRMKLPVDGSSGEGSLPRPEPQEIWVETFVRLSPNYMTLWAYDPRVPDYDMCGNGAHKFLFFGRRFPSTRSTWRFEIATQGNFIKIKGAENKDYNQYTGSAFVPMGDPNHHPDFLPNPCVNGVWMRWRYHLRAASAHGVSDGHVEWRWVEMDNPDVVVFNECSGRKMWYLGETPFEAHQGWNELQLGLTYNAGPLDPTYFEYGEIRVWKDDPGWGW